nr:3'-5' exonuclease [Massilibacteroides vaginae]
MKENKAAKYELVENYRSKSNLVDFTNQFIKTIRNRLKQTPIIAQQTDNGKIKLVRHQSANLILPLIDDILSAELTGTTCILTKQNEKAEQIAGLLLKNKIPAKLIQTNDGFNLYNLVEIRFFLSCLNLADDVFTISDDSWDKAKRELKNRFQNSTKLEVCNNIIRDFEATNPKTKYKTDLEVFIRESKLEDFFDENGETIFVSTIHKAKGKEFDNIFLMLENFNPTTDEAKRQLYVAMTRAKQNLTIHINSDFLDNISTAKLERIVDEKMYLPPKEIVMHLTHKDVWLDYFINKQHLISQLTSGDVLVFNGTSCLNSNGESVLKFSTKMTEEIQNRKEKGFELKTVKINFIVFWQKEELDKEIKLILPELYFTKVL